MTTGGLGLPKAHLPAKLVFKLLDRVTMTANKQKERNMQKKILAVTIFNMAVGLVETIVAIYLRQVYYPEGFGFPLKEAIWVGL